ncbi:uncharacterized protein LOC119980923 isoform X48 [Tripterygium wilfordii]|uniref:uncharacterized protein LOC119980923 isoform X48 n=1 Tax=Tripterygium wilfordii TaxID=458696 RepID=UPI0018F80F15|nr:uncharacterized protein LOC119980923 isoform X48 [Tripterygium wilfordii]
MASSAAGSSDLNKSSSANKEVTSPTSSPLVINQTASAAEADVEGGLTTPNQGIGDTDQTATGQLSAEEARKRAKKETDARHHNKRKTKLENYDKMSSDFGKLQLENEHLRKENEHSRKENESLKQLAESRNKETEKFESRITSLTDENYSLLKENKSLLLQIVNLYEENNQLKKEKECWKNLYTQQQPVDSNSYGQVSFQSMHGHLQPMPTGDGGSVSQQHVNSSFSSQFQSMHGHSQPMPTGGGGSVSQQHVNSSFPGQVSFQNMDGHSQPMPTGGGGSVSQQHVNSSFPGQFQNMDGHSQPMPTDGGGSVSQQHANSSFPGQPTGGGKSGYPFIGREKFMELSYAELPEPSPPMQTGGREAYPTSGN